MLFYSGKREIRIGKYMGYLYVIQGSKYPCAYIKIPSCNKTFYRNDTFINELSVHGGITYGDIYYPNSPVGDRKGSDFFIGWDYAHTGDALDFDDIKVEGKHWTLEEITEDCKSVIGQVITKDAEAFLNGYFSSIAIFNRYFWVCFITTAFV